MRNPLGFLGRLIAIVSLLAVITACSSSSDDDGDERDETSDLSEDEAEEKIDAVLAAFESAAEDDDFEVDDDDDDDDDESKLECEGFESFTSDEDTIADESLSVTDGNEPEITQDGSRIVFDGGEVTGSVDVGVLEGDRLERALDEALADLDGFTDCIENGMEERDPPIEGATVDLEVSVEEGDAGDQEIVMSLEGTMSGVTEGYDFEIEVAANFRYIRIGSAGLVTNAQVTGVGIDNDSILPAIEAAIDEFENQFG